MGAHHFFVAGADDASGTITITGPEAHHAARVLRVRAGESITISDGNGVVFETVIAGVDDDVVCDVHKRREYERPKPMVTLHQALTKGEKMDEVIEKSIEVGVLRIVPFVAQRSIVRWDAGKQRKGVDRWNAIAAAASKQSRSPWLATVGDVDSGLPEVRNEPVLVLHEEADVRLRDVLPAQPTQTLHLVVGPEGSLADDEVSALRAGGATIASLGERILRTETAGMVAASLIAYHYGTLG